MTYSLGMRSTGNNMMSTYYINLDLRTDRKQLMEKELSNMGLAFTRFPLYKTKQEQVGRLGARVAMWNV